MKVLENLCEFLYETITLMRVGFGMFVGNKFENFLLLFFGNTVD